MAKRQQAVGGARAEASRQREKYWRRIIAERQASGLTHTEFCRRRSISSHTYFWWKRELQVRDEKRLRTATARAGRRARCASSPLVPVTIRTRMQTAARVDSQLFEVVLANQRMVRVPAGFDVETLRRLVAVLEEGTC